MEQIIKYEGVGPYEGVTVDAEEALAFALSECGLPCTPAEIDRTRPDAQEFCEMLVEWFFSGSWISVEAGDE